MKVAAIGLLSFGISVLLLGHVWAGQSLERAERFSEVTSFLPGDDEIPGWKLSERILKATNEEELYKIFNGGASLYIQHGFHSFVGQNYKGPKATELEVHIFAQRNYQNAQDLFENPFVRPSRMKAMANLGERARIDMSPLFSNGVDFVQKRFFVRVIIQDKTEEGLDVAISFARFISNRIK